MIYQEQIRWKVFIILINISIEINGLIDTILPGEKYVLLQNMGANKKSNKNVNKGHSEEEQENKEDWKGWADRFKIFFRLLTFRTALLLSG